VVHNAPVAEYVSRHRQLSRVNPDAPAFRITYRVSNASLACIWGTDLAGSPAVGSRRDEEAEVAAEGELEV